MNSFAHNMFRGMPSEPTESEMDAELTPERREFLENDYLREQYLVPADVADMLRACARQLLEEQPGFAGIVNAGSTANGSLVMRRKLGGKQAADLDFYLMGTSETLDHLGEIAETVGTSAKRVGLDVDMELNGRKPDNFLNLDEVDEHIAREEYNLLALPFQSAYGHVSAAREAVLEAIEASDDPQVVWDEVASYHIQSLSMHHGSWPVALGTAILQKYYPEKIAEFELPETPQEAHGLPVQDIS